MSEYKQCPNGHYYQGSTCPYCKSSNGGGATTSGPTQIFGSGNSQDPTETMQGGGTKTTFAMGGETMGPNNGGGRQSAGANRTVFGDEDTINDHGGGGSRTGGGYRETRKLVGWLVTYSLDPMGVDFKLYEGRNIIGRDADCSISVNDNMVSSKHAVLLFREGKYAIQDQMSSHGTIVNGRNIELEPCYLQDGDEIRMGKTVFKFRTSLF